ncbi:MAG TPA: hypothetical protein VMF89_11835, partial [Polyangiales bacterium]|nr:hypothetical protein [Polyangiales bacterium]
MRITIDNLDGQGARDYTSSIAPEGPITIQRTLNAPTRCTAQLVVGADGLPLPSRLGRVVVESESGDTLFTGYLATEPVRVYAGEASAGSVYLARLSAVSDEWLLDRAGSGAAQLMGESLSLAGNQLLARMAARAQAGVADPLTMSSTSNSLSSGVFTARAGVPWSVNAGEAASAAYSGYRALNGEIMVQTAGSTTHSFSDADGSLSVAELQTGTVRELANDVTLSGAEEPAAYISESFAGDGTTTEFTLSEAVFRQTKPTWINDSFAGPTVDTTVWQVTDSGAHLSLGAGGLVLNGGNGQDGQTTLSALDALEIGGSVVIELGGVVFGAASDGMLAGLYPGAVQLAECFAGFRVRQSTSTTGGVTVVVPVLNGAEVGTVFTPTTGHTYTLRLRLHCVEVQRVMQRYYCMVDGVVQGFGDLGGVSAPCDVVLELVDEGAASNTPA